MNFVNDFDYDAERVSGYAFMRWTFIHSGKEHDKGDVQPGSVMTPGLLVLRFHQKRSIPGAGFFSV